MIQANVHSRLAQRRSFFKECEIKKTVRYRNITFFGVAEFFSFEKPIVEHG
jgi:hypothetical protein